MTDINIDSLIGETLLYADTSDEKEIVLTTKSGKTILLTYDEQCCEVFTNIITEGNWHSLYGKPIIDVAHKQTHKHSQQKERDNSSVYFNTITFAVDDATVKIAVIGVSQDDDEGLFTIADISGSPLAREY